MNDSLFSDLAPAPVRVPRCKTDGDIRPTWGKYRTVKPVQCDHCVAAAMESLMAHEGCDGIRSARFKRSQGTATQLLCHAHMRAQRAVDEVKWPSKRSAA